MPHLCRNFGDSAQRRVLPIFENPRNAFQIVGAECPICGKKNFTLNRILGSSIISSSVLSFLSPAHRKVSARSAPPHHILARFNQVFERLIGAHPPPLCYTGVDQLYSCADVQGLFLQIVGQHICLLQYRVPETKH